VWNKGLQPLILVLDSSLIIPPSIASGGQEIAMFAIVTQAFERRMELFRVPSMNFISNKEKEIVCSVSKKEIR